VISLAGILVAMRRDPVGDCAYRRSEGGMVWPVCSVLPML
jgi:hypothetical protein